MTIGVAKVVFPFPRQGNGNRHNGHRQTRDRHLRLVANRSTHRFRIEAKTPNGLLQCSDLANRESGWLWHKAHDSDEALTTKRTNPEILSRASHRLRVRQHKRRRGRREKRKICRLRPMGLVVLFVEAEPRFEHLVWSCSMNGSAAQFSGPCACPESNGLRTSRAWSGSLWEATVRAQRKDYAVNLILLCGSMRFCAGWSVCGVRERARRSRA